MRVHLPISLWVGDPSILLVGVFRNSRSSESIEVTFLSNGLTQETFDSLHSFFGFSIRLGVIWAACLVVKLVLF